MNRHLPAGQGQGMPPDAGRRRSYNHHNGGPQYSQAQQFSPYQVNPAHLNQNQGYNNGVYYPQYHNPYPGQYQQPHYNQPAMAPYGQYAQYQNMGMDMRPQHLMQHYGPQHVPVQYQPPQQAYRPPQSPAQPPVVVSTPVQVSGPAPPHAQAPLPSQISSHAQHPPPPPSTHSSYSHAESSRPATPQVATSEARPPTPNWEDEYPRFPFRPNLPWYSVDESLFPPRRPRRKRRIAVPLTEDNVELPATQNINSDPINEESVLAEEIAPPLETPSASHPPSEEAHSTNPTTPSSAHHPTSFVREPKSPVTPKAAQQSLVSSKRITPALPKTSRDTPKITAEKTAEEDESVDAEKDVSSELGADEALGVEELTPTPPAAITAWTKPKVWSGVFKPNTPQAPATTNGTDHADVPASGQASSLADALSTFKPEDKDAKVAFLKPRGLVNSGNMCYMNSVLQVLVFCSPFYNFLNQVNKKAVHSFKSDTPLIDSMVMFMREFPIIDSATSVEQLRLRLKDGELEQYGEAFTPSFVYDVINHLPRFSSMRRGHQQDAEEFLGFLLEGLHDESVRVIKASGSNSTSALATPTNGPSSPISDTASAAGKAETWLEVGRKQKASTTRSSGNNDNSPISSIFGGKLRSELRIPGHKDSVTQEPYQRLQLDIGAANVVNIVDALKALTRSETLHGDFKSPNGQSVSGVKQFFIEEIPPVLILHLKRFQYDNTGGTQKIWKKVGYPLELELPAEVFPRNKRNTYRLSGGLPKYRLSGVVYHHGESASGGHYTVDVRRQDGREWVRLDDTLIKRVRSEDVAEAGSEEDAKVLAAALEAQKQGNTSGNPFAAIDEENHADDEGWKKASGPGKKWSSVVNGASTPKRKTNEKFSVKDKKVAYLLFYQKI